jgi:hypothetical protein
MKNKSGKISGDIVVNGKFVELEEYLNMVGLGLS